MTDYLNSVKKLVERLNLQSSGGKGPARVSGKKTKLKEKSHGSVSDTVIPEQQGEVRYRHRRKHVDKDLSDTTKLREKSKIDMSDTPTIRRQSVSLYQLIKLNKEKLSGKNNPEYQLNMSTASSPISPPDNKRRTIFEFNVYDSSEVDSGESDSSLTVYQKRSPRPSRDMTSSLLLSPVTPLSSSKNFLNIGEHDFASSDHFEFRESESKPPLSSSPVFSDTESTNSLRKSSRTSRPRLSGSKSMPLSPPAANAERSAQQFCDFQLKLDTLRAELLAMRKADQELAKRLLNLYSEIQILKVKNSCMNYSNLIDEAMYEAEMADELPDMCDAPKKFTNKLLTSHGVTSFNIHSRRFSCS